MLDMFYCECYTWFTALIVFTGIFYAISQIKLILRKLFSIKH